MEKIRNVISALVADHSGVLLRIAEIFGSRGYNVESICSGVCEEPNCQRITIVCNESLIKIDKVIKLLSQLIDVYEVSIINPKLEITRELLLAKLKISGDKKELLDFLKLIGAKLINLNDQSVSFEFSSTAMHIDDVCKKIIQKYKIIEMARTGEAAITK